MGNKQLATRGNEPIPTTLPKSEQPVTLSIDSNDAVENEIDYIKTNDSLNDVNDSAQQRNEQLHDDVSKRNEATEAENNENSGWPESAVCPKNDEKSLPHLSDRQENDTNFLEEISSRENDAQDSPEGGMILSCPKYCRMMIGRKIWVLEERKIISGLTLIQTTQKISDTATIELTRKREFFSLFLYLFDPFFLNFLNKWRRIATGISYK